MFPWKHSQYFLRHLDFLQLHPFTCMDDLESSCRLGVVIFALLIFWLANWCRLPDDQAELYRERYATEEPAETTPL